jgi:hypothetical protein
MALAQAKEDREELRQERDDWRREAEKLIATKLREADHSADGWEDVLKPVVARYRGKVSRRLPGSVHADQHIARLDDRVSLLPLLELEFVDRLVGD